jgi:NAD(P)-dependent dehydrogenase (short-subunit alcohol dehydrogenase family)
MPDPFRLDSKIVAVVGAGAGIGREVALGSARQGARTVVCLDVDEAAAARIAVECGGAAGRVDITDAADVERALGDIRQRFGALDALVCTPGLNVRKRILDYTDADVDRVLAINLKGSFNVLRAAGRLMVEQRRGALVFFSSIRAQVVEPGQSVYAATKAGIVQLVRTAAAEFGPFGVRVNTVAPGVVDTPLTAPIRANPEWQAAYAAKSVFNRWARADEMVGPAIFLVSDAASFVTGTVLMADGGWTAADGRFTPPGMERSAQ